MVAWQVWRGQSSQAQPQIFNPSDGGRRSTATITLSPRNEAQQSRGNERPRPLLSQSHSYSLRTEGTRLKGETVTRRTAPGAGWNDGFGEGIAEGSGYSGLLAAGSGSDYVAVFGGCSRARSSGSGVSVGRHSHTVIVLDVSGSMQLGAGPENSSNPEWEVAVCFRQLWSARTFNVVCFSHTAVKFRSEGIPVTAENIWAATGWVKERCRAPRGDFSPEVPRGTGGPSRLDLGLQTALCENPGRLFLISDGRPVIREAGQSLSRAAMLERISKALLQAEREPYLEIIDTAAPGTLASGGFLRELVDRCGGTYRKAGSLWADFKEPLRFRLTNLELRPR